MKIIKIDKEHTQDLKIKNEPFDLKGKIEVTFDGKDWHSIKILFSDEEIKQMTFPDEDYDFDKLNGHVLFGAYENNECVGLAILTKDFNSRLYLSNLKVKRNYRHHGVAKSLLNEAYKYVLENELIGLFTICQDNNVDAFDFYIKFGFKIGGYDNNVYRNTKQEGKADILLYLDIPRKEN